MGDRVLVPAIDVPVVENADLVVITSDNPRTEDPDAIISDIVSGSAGPASRSPSPETPGVALSTGWNSRNSRSPVGVSPTKYAATALVSPEPADPVGPPQSTSSPPEPAPNVATPAPETGPIASPPIGSEAVRWFNRLLVGRRPWFRLLHQNLSRPFDLARRWRRR